MISPGLMLEEDAESHKPQASILNSAMLCTGIVAVVKQRMNSEYNVPTVDDLTLGRCAVVYSQLMSQNLHCTCDRSCERGVHTQHGTYLQTPKGALCSRCRSQVGKLNSHTADHSDPIPDLRDKESDHTCFYCNAFYK